MPVLPSRNALRVKTSAGATPTPGWQRDLVLLLLVLVLLWAWNSPWVWPLKILVVLFHETGHALMTVATGGGVVALAVSPNESGEVQSAGGWPILTLNAGYLGSLAWGMALLRASRRSLGAQRMSAALAAFFVLVAVLWARPVLSFGMFATLGAASLFGLLAGYGGDGFAALVLRLIGTFSVLYSLGDVVDDVLLRPGSPSDAAFLAERTGIPALAWGLSWSFISLASLRLLASRLR